MKKLLLLCFLIPCTYSFSQDTIYVDKNYHWTIDLGTAKYYQVIERTSDNADAGIKRTYSLSGQLKVEETFSSFENNKREGKRRLWRENGSLYRESNYKDDILEGELFSYWQNGEVKRRDVYEKGELQEGKVYDVSGHEIEWYPMEIKPVFPGGEKGLVNYLKKNSKKPKGVAGGRVVVGFVVDVDGSITDIEIEESTLPALNLAAYNAVSNMPRWEPGKQDGEAVRVKYSLPLRFPN